MAEPLQCGEQMTPRFKKSCFLRFNVHPANRVKKPKACNQKRIWGTPVFLLFCAQAQARDLGNAGQTFAILEQDLLAVIESRLKGLNDTGELSSHIQKIQTGFEDKVKHPQAGAFLPRAKEVRTYTYNPALTVPYDLKDHQGKIFHKTGTRINPLDSMPLSKELIFFNGDDPEQVSWVQNYMKNQKSVKLILTQGAPFELMESLGRPVFFDQYGHLSKKLKLTHVPAVVKQQGKKLVIEEILIEDIQKHPGQGKQQEPATDSSSQSPSDLQGDRP